MHALQTFKPDTHAVDVTVALGQHGLGLVLGKEEAGSRWAVKGFRDMPDGQPNPASVSFFYFCENAAWEEMSWSFDHLI